MAQKILDTEDFLSYEKDPLIVEAILEEFDKFISQQLVKIILPEERTLSLTTIEGLLSGLVRTSSLKAIKLRSEERFLRNEERKRDLPELKGKSTSPSTQYKYQLLDYLIYGNGATLKGHKAYISEYEAYSFMAKLIVILQIDNSLNYEKLKLNAIAYTDVLKSIHESLRTDYRNNYVSGTLEGFPKGIRINSAYGGPRVISLKQ